MIRYYLLLILTACLLCAACGKRNEANSLRLAAKPLNAKVNGHILTGPSVLNDSSRFVWGASVIEGEDGKFHMFYNTWECGESIPRFTDSWVLYSKIAYAVSDLPDQDFIFQSIVLEGRQSEGATDAWDAQMVTNPHIKRFEDTYYLYYTGSRDPGPQPGDSAGAKLSKRDRVQQSQQIGVLIFKSFTDLIAGRYTRPESPLLSPRTRVKATDILDPSPEGTPALPDNIVTVNPSVVKRANNGKYMMYFKGNLYDPHWRGVHGLAIADSPSGPFQALDQFVFDIRLPDGHIASAEDPFVWFHPIHHCYYAIVKDFSGAITREEPGLALLQSTDGIQWQQARQSMAMKKEVILQQGDTIILNRLERPQLLLDHSGYPLVLYGAASLVNINPRTDGASFNVHIPLVSGEW